jgi:hypothetical protein
LDSRYATITASPLLRPETEADQLVDRFLAVLDNAARRCLGTEDAWMAQDLKRAMILIGGPDEEMAQRIWTRTECRFRRDGRVL